MPFWLRRREALNEQLLREAGLGAEQDGSVAPLAEPADGDADLRPPPEPLLWRSRPALRVSHFAASDLGSMPLPRLDDAVVTVEAPGLSVEAFQFATLPDGTVLVEDPRPTRTSGRSPTPVGGVLPPPYRARCRRQDDDWWELDVGDL